MQRFRQEKKHTIGLKLDHLHKGLEYIGARVVLYFTCSSPVRDSYVLQTSKVLGKNSLILYSSCRINQF